MHEMSLAGGILQLVEDSASREAFSQVRQLRLSVPALAGVEVQALRFALECLAPNTLLQGALIHIEQPPGEAWCLDCCRSLQINERGQPCPHCGGWKLQVTGGTELRLIDLMVD